MSRTTSLFLLTLLFSFAAVTMAQTYTIAARVIQSDPKNWFSIVEKTNWYFAKGGTWTECNNQHNLTMGDSGTSGMLRFKNPANEYFLVALGVHNLRRWCDIVVNAASTDTGVMISPTYYQGGSRVPIRTAQLARLEKTTASGLNVTVDYYVADTTTLQATITISKLA